MIEIENKDHINERFSPSKRKNAWNIIGSPRALATINSIRNIVDTMEFEFNPNYSPIHLTMG